MPRTRPDDFHELAGYPGQHPWARWWRHRDGTVSSAHYEGHTGKVIIAFRRDPSCNIFEPLDRARASREQHARSVEDAAASAVRDYPDALARLSGASPRTDQTNGETDGR